MSIRFLALFLLFIPGILFSQKQDSIPVTRGTNERLKIKILPNGYYRPETRIALGAFVLLTFKGNHKDTAAHWSFFKSTLMVTQNKQIALENDWQIFMRKEKYITYGGLDVTKFPELFFGIGNNTSLDSAEENDLSRISHASLLLQKIRKNIFLGVNLNTQYLWGKNSNPFVRYKDVTGAGGYFANGIGPTFLLDSRDNVLNTGKGWYNEVSVTFQNNYTLSNYDFVSYLINSRNFLPVLKNSSWAKNWTWANEIYLNFNTGAVPFRSNPVLGGVRFLRGYYTGRFRDKNLIFYQTELRVPVYWRIGVVAFAGVGQVAPDLKSFSIPQMKLSAGGGIRFMLSKRERANIRFDYGFTKEGGGFYLIFGESF